MDGTPYEPRSQKDFGLMIERKENESIVIQFQGVEIWVTPKKVRSNRVRILIGAPREVNVAREEIYVKGYKRPEGT